MCLRKVVENNLVCGILLAAAHEGRRSVFLESHVVKVLGHRGCGLKSGLAVRARRAAVLAGVDMTSVMQSACKLLAIAEWSRERWGLNALEAWRVGGSVSQSPESRVFRTEVPRLA